MSLVSPLYRGRISLMTEIRGITSRSGVFLLRTDRDEVLVLEVDVLLTDG